MRKYNIGLHLAHQEFRQLQSRSADVASSVLSNCYTRICFRLGDTDAEKFSSGFSFFDSKALQNLGVGEAVGRVERADYDFNLKIPLLPNIAKETAHHKKQAVIQNTRENFSKPKSEVEAELLAIRPLTQTIAQPKAEKTDQVGKVTAKEKPTEKPDITNSEINTEKDTQTDGSHRYLQSIIKRIGEAGGFVATLEKQVFGGIGKVDVALENEHLKIACEIAVTNTVDYELQNIQKGLASGFEKVAVISTDSKHLANIRKKAESIISTEQLAKVHFLEPDNFHLFLEKLNVEANSQTDRKGKVKGYTVDVRFREISRAEREDKKQVIAGILKLAETRRK